MSATGVYTNSLADNLPSQHSVASSSEDTPASSTSSSSAGSKDSIIRRAQIPGTGTAIRSAPRVLRLWVAPWEDSDGDLHDQFYVYLTIDPGRWVIEHQRSKIQNQYSTTLKNSSGSQSSDSNAGTKNSPSNSKGTENVKP
jgi:conjugal transfer pilus assembly protein TraV